MTVVKARACLSLVFLSNSNRNSRLTHENTSFAVTSHVSNGRTLHEMPVGSVKARLVSDEFDRRKADSYASSWPEWPSCVLFWSHARPYVRPSLMEGESFAEKPAPLQYSYKSVPQSSMFVVRMNDKSSIRKAMEL